MITLPKPPSVNSLYGRNGHRTYIKPEGQAWFQSAGLLLNSQYKKKGLKKVALYIKIYYCGRYDVDNGLKATLDLLQHCGVVENDSEVIFLQIEKFKVAHRQDQKMEIEIP